MEIASWETVGALCALGAAVTWAATSLLVRTLVAAFGSVAINAIRSSVSGALLLAWVLLVQGPGALTSISAEAFWLLAISIVAAIGVGDTVFFESTRRLGLARALTISMTYPLMAAALAVVVFGEAVTPQIALGSVLTLGGLVLIVSARGAERPGAEGWWRGVGEATLAAFAWAVSVVLMKAPLQEVEAVTAQAVRLPLAGVLLFATPWARGAIGRLRLSDRAVLWRFGALSLLTALSAVMFVAGLKYADVVVATVLSSTAPMFAIPLGLVFLGERLAPRAVLGTLVTVAGIVVLQL